LSTFLMKNLNFRFPVIVIALSVLLGFFMNYRNGMTWPENRADMTGTAKVITYLVLFAVIFVWRNWKRK